MNRFKKLFKIVGIIAIIVLCLIIILNILNYFNYSNIKLLKENQVWLQKFILISNNNSEATENFSNQELAKLKAQEEEINNLNEIISIGEQREREWKQVEQTYIDRINELEDELANNQRLDRQQANQEKNYKDMALYFNQMNAKNAAEIAGKMDNNLIIGIISKMDKEAAAELLESLPIEKAAAVSRQMLEVAP